MLGRRSLYDSSLVSFIYLERCASFSVNVGDVGFLWKSIPAKRWWIFDCAPFATTYKIGSGIQLRINKNHVSIFPHYVWVCGKLIHEAGSDHYFQTVSVCPSVRPSQNFKIKRQSLPAGTVGRPSGSLMTPVLYKIFFLKWHNKVILSMTQFVFLQTKKQFNTVKLSLNLVKFYLSVVSGGLINRIIQIQFVWVENQFA